MNILFLCTGNSCRSIMAEAIFTAVAPAGCLAASAGSKPTGYVHPRALKALEQAGMDTANLTSKSWESLSVTPDVVITLCADAAGESCPVYFGQVVRAHWGMPDPAKAQGDDVAIDAAFLTTLQVLRKRIENLVNQLEANPSLHGQDLQDVLDAIAAH